MNLSSLALKTILRKPRAYISLGFNIFLSFVIVFACVLLYLNPSYQFLVETLKYDSNFSLILNQFPRGLFVSLAILSLFSIVYSLIFIYQERRRDLGIFLIHGFSHIQFRKLLFFEITLVGFVAIVVGIIPAFLLEVLLRYILQSKMNILTFDFDLNLFPILIFVTIFLLIAITSSFIVQIMVQKSKVIYLLKGQERINLEPKIAILRSIFSFIIMLFLTLFCYFIDVDLMDLIDVFLRNDLSGIIVLIMIILSIFIGVYLFIVQGSLFIVYYLRKNIFFSWKGSRILNLGGLAGRLKQNSFFIAILTGIFSFIILFFGIQEIDTHYNDKEVSDNKLSQMEVGPYLNYYLGEGDLSIFADDVRFENFDKTKINFHSGDKTQVRAMWQHLQRKYPFLASDTVVVPYIRYLLNDSPKKGYVFEEDKEMFADENIFIHFMSVDDYNKVAKNKVKVQDGQFLSNCLLGDRICRSFDKFLKNRFPDKQITYNYKITNMEANPFSTPFFVILSPKDFQEQLSLVNQESPANEFKSRSYLGIMSIYPSNNLLPNKEMLKNIADIKYYYEDLRDNAIKQNNFSFANRYLQTSFYYYFGKLFIVVKIYIYIALFFILLIALIFVSSRLYSDINNQSKQLYSLYRIGTSAKIIRNSVSFQLGVLFFCPAILGIIFASFPLALIMRMNYYDQVFNIFDYTLIQRLLIPALIFFGFIAGLYLISRDWILRLLRRESDNKI